MHGYVSVADAEQRRDLSNIDVGLRQVGDKVWSSDRSLLKLNSVTGFVKSEGGQIEVLVHLQLCSEVLTKTKQEEQRPSSFLLTQTSLPRWPSSHLVD